MQPEAPSRQPCSVPHLEPDDPTGALEPGDPTGGRLDEAAAAICEI